MRVFEPDFRNGAQLARLYDFKAVLAKGEWKLCETLSSARPSVEMWKTSLRSCLGEVFSVGPIIGPAINP